MTIQKLGQLKVVPIYEVVDETPKGSRMPVKAFSFIIPEIAKQAIPGQFAMMWLNGIDEKPMGIASADPKTGKLVFAVAKVGPATESFHNLQKGDLLGIRGPFGKGFTLNGRSIAAIGGGTGIAPTRFLVEQALLAGKKVTLFHGARNVNELAFKKFFDRLAKENNHFIYRPSTDDGTLGFKGFSTQCWEQALTEGYKFDQIYSCGPELMMYTAFTIAQKKKIPFEACLADRYFKCAIGLCGQCTVDPLGLRLCMDGPVFNQDQLSKIEDFGKYARDKFGRKEPI